MNYTFPTINNIDDVLPHIKGRSEFIVAERDGYIVINYVVALKETFDMDGVDDLGGAIRRECRGLIFYPDGKIMSRSVHKFFNINEREETRVENLNIMRAHSIKEKMDGSMIRPLYVDGRIQLGTKMGLTDIGADAQQWLDSKSSITTEWMMRMVLSNLTPIFEWISPNNKIVIDYPEDNLVMLAIRENVSGLYVARPTIFDRPKVYSAVEGNLGEYVDQHLGDQGREGFIMQFSDGHMVKGKNEWYVRIHKTKDRIRTDRHVINIILNEELDDLVPLLDGGDLDRVRSLESEFWTAFNRTFNRITGLHMSCRDKTKKEVALDVVPHLEHKQYARFLFAMMDGKDLRTLLLAASLNATGNTSRYDELRTWLHN